MELRPVDIVPNLFIVDLVGVAKYSTDDLFLRRLSLSKILYGEASQYSSKSTIQYSAVSK